MIQTRWTKNETDILLSMFGKMPYQSIADLLPGRTWTMVRNKANILGLTKNSNLGRKYSANKSFFSIPNILNCYWAGFIAADGNVSRNKLSVKLKPDDGHHLEQLIKDLEYTGVVFQYPKSSQIQITCQEIVDDLKINFNIVERKSKILEPPNLVNETLIKSFILGLIDGDGSVIIYKSTKKPVIVLYGTRLVLEWMKSYVDTWTTKSNYKKAEVNQIQKHLHSYKVCGKRAKEVGKILSSIKVPKLNRKWQPMIEFLGA